MLIALSGLLTPGLDKVFTDLGSGDGRVLEAAGRRGVYVVGIEISDYLCRVSRDRLKRAGVIGDVVQADFYRLPLRRVDVAYMYLWRSIIERLASLLSEALKPGGLIVTLDASIPWMKPSSVRLIRTSSGIIRILCVYRLQRARDGESSGKGASEDRC